MIANEVNDGRSLNSAANTSGQIFALISPREIFQKCLRRASKKRYARLRNSRQMGEIFEKVQSPCDVRAIRSGHPEPRSRSDSILHDLELCE